VISAVSLSRYLASSSGQIYENFCDIALMYRGVNTWKRHTLEPEMINIKTPAARRHLKPYRDPYWQKLDGMKGASLGFKRSDRSGVETWHARCYLDGRYFAKNLGEVRPEFDYAQAHRAAREFADSLKQHGERAINDYTLADVIEEYYEHLRGDGTPREIKRMNLAAKRLEPLIPKAMLHRQANSLTMRDIVGLQRAYRKRKKEDGRPILPDTVNRTMTPLIAALNHGLRLEMVSDNSAWKNYRRLPRSMEKRKQHQYLPLKERERFIEAAPADLQDFLIALHTLGARPSEIRRLQRSDIDLSNNRIRLVTYKGARGSERWLPIPNRLKAVLERRNTEPVFTTETGRPWSMANLAKKHRAAQITGGFSPDFEPYAWRHSRLSDWSRAGNPAPEVAHVAGTSLEMIQHHYYKPSEDLHARMLSS
jgi:integrase